MITQNAQPAQTLPTVEVIPGTQKRSTTAQVTLPSGKVRRVSID